MPFFVLRKNIIKCNYYIMLFTDLLIHKQKSTMFLDMYKGITVVFF